MQAAGCHRRKLLALHSSGSRRGSITKTTHKYQFNHHNALLCFTRAGSIAMCFKGMRVRFWQKACSRGLSPLAAAGSSNHLDHTNIDCTL